MIADTHIVALFLEPVERLLCTVCTVSRSCLHSVSFRVCTASTGNLWLGKRDIRGRACHVALETIHIICREHVSQTA